MQGRSRVPFVPVTILGYLLGRKAGPPRAETGVLEDE
jgi:hypothetical protein